MLSGISADDAERAIKEVVEAYRSTMYTMEEFVEYGWKEILLCSMALYLSVKGCDTQ